VIFRVNVDVKEHAPDIEYSTVYMFTDDAVGEIIPVEELITKPAGEALKTPPVSPLIVGIISEKVD
jgi:hypothetical protein